MKLKNAVFISGAGQRIGLYLAQRFLQQGECPVVFSYRTRHAAVEELEAQGAVGIGLDFTQRDALDVLSDFFSERVHSLRAVIHNASLWANDAAIDADPSLYAAMFRLHVEMPYRLNGLLAPYLLASDSALKDIVSLSDSATDAAHAEHIGYLASKAALQNLSRNFAKKYAPQIKVNDIAPGLILFHSHDSESDRQQRLARSALPLEPGAEVIWQALQYLLNSPYTTGISLPVDGGQHLV
jgi:dihydromonapterin reductase/dihydrofolate reductase